MKSESRAILLGLTLFGVAGGLGVNWANEAQQTPTHPSSVTVDTFTGTRFETGDPIPPRIKLTHFPTVVFEKHLK